MLKVSKFALFTCCREMQVDINLVDSKDDNFVNILVLTPSKDYEATESLEFFEFVQNAFAQLRKTA